MRLGIRDKLENRRKESYGIYKTLRFVKGPKLIGTRKIKCSREYNPDDLFNGERNIRYLLEVTPGNDHIYLKSVNFF